ncbi:SNF2 family N-terminal domain-containing protein [Fimicolochytrium jonesii]|uniref:SNF2 family N-terminal domain-containing protein n=1 Tax=Fimicolochytrium jonesii TaxID=1396493 RepID=UPI0022FE3FC3|nr:SNF2 family N-terminal domain-containing protein [Fimicolochytrium jonesii]KAI8819951.1 SNF2 family N-terminal domain-containing protein [Fimicolochytrium jonesii]
MTQPDFASLRGILGDEVPSMSLGVLLAESKGDLSRACHLYFENPGKYQRLAIQAADAGVKRKAEEDAAMGTRDVKRVKAAGGAGSPHPDGELKYAGDVILVALATIRGPNQLRDGDEIETIDHKTVYSAQPTSKRYPRASKTPRGPITRIRAGGKEVAKMSKDDAKVLGKLVEMDVIVIRGTVVSAPPSLTLLCDIILQLRIFFTKKAFMTVASADDEDTQDQTIKDRKIALLTLFKMLGLRPFDPAEAGLKEDAAVDAASSGGAVPGEDAVEDEKELEEDQVEVLYEKARGFEDVQEMEPKEGLVIDLRGYQKQALSWMAAKENLQVDSDSHSIHPLWEEYALPSPGNQCEAHPQKIYLNPYTGEMQTRFPSAADRTRAGILADEMGLGKTLETLALIHTNRPTQEEMGQSSWTNQFQPFARYAAKGNSTDSVLPSSRATLVVCPLSLLSQWRDEVTERFRPGTLSHAVFYGTERSLKISDLTSKDAPDVVITTYGVVASEWQATVKTNKRASLIFGVQWFRVVLDEAHWIKNQQTATAKSCHKIDARRRWCVTGTPIQNRLEDLFSLVHFLRIEPWGNYSFWRQFITVPFANKDPKALNVVQSVLEPLVLRRQKTTRVGPEGRPIVELPPKTVETEYLDFTKEERDIYTALFTKSKTQFSAFCAAGSVLSHWAHVFQMLTRLRQCCLHPELALGKGNAAASASTSSADGSDMDIDALIKRFQNGLDGNSSTTGTSDRDTYVDTVFQRLAQAGKSPLNGTSPSQEDDDSSCPICFDLMVQPTLFPCLHMSCFECIVGYLQKREQMGEKGECPICRKEFREEDLLDIVRAPSAPAATAVSAGDTQTDGKQSSTTLVDDNKENGKTDSDTIITSPPPPLPTHTITLRRHFHASTKLLTLIHHLTHLRTTQPDVKTVVFSQFTSMLNLCEIVLQEHGFGFCRLDGTMSQREREATLRRFASDEGDAGECRVLLASMRSAGVGLNLVRASFVVIMEPWWNVSIVSTPLASPPLDSKYLSPLAAI